MSLARRPSTPGFQTSSWRPGEIAIRAVGLVIASHTSDREATTRTGCTGGGRGPLAIALMMAGPAASGLMRFDGAKDCEEIFYDRCPEDVEIDVEVVVYESVTHARCVVPRDFRILLAS